MSPLLLETIQIKNGKIIAPEYHTERINRSCFELFGINNIIKLEDIVKVPPAYASGIYKCRIIYNKNDKKP